MRRPRRCWSTSRATWAPRGGARLPPRGHLGGLDAIIPDRPGLARGRHTPAAARSSWRCSTVAPAGRRVAGGAVPTCDGGSPTAASSPRVGGAGGQARSTDGVVGRRGQGEGRLPGRHRARRGGPGGPRPRGLAARGRQRRVESRARARGAAAGASGSRRPSNRCAGHSRASDARLRHAAPSR